MIARSPSDPIPCTTGTIRNPPRNPTGGPYRIETAAEALPPLPETDDKMTPEEFIDNLLLDYERVQVGDNSVVWVKRTSR